MNDLDWGFVALSLFFGAVFFQRVVTENTLTINSVESDAVTLGDVVIKANGPEISVSKKKAEDGKDRVIKHKADDGNFYWVAASLGEKERAANFLAEISRREQYLLQTIDDALADGAMIKAKDGVIITDNMKILVKKHFKKVTPFAEYHNVHDRTVGSNSSKGELVEL